MIAVKNRLKDFFDQTETMLTIALADAVVSRALEDFGYAMERIAAGMTMFREVQQMHAGVQAFSVDDATAFEELFRVWDRANQAYLLSLRIARVAFKDHPKVASLLKLHGERNRSIAGWLDQTEGFYHALHHESGLLSTMSGFGYTAEKIQAEYQLQKQVRELHNRLMRHAGESIQVVEARERRLTQLDCWLADFRAVSKVALASHPHQMERLGLFERG